jgi:hypothetical protein
VVFLAHYTGGGINSVLEMNTDEFFEYLECAFDLYKNELERPVRVVLSGIEKK